MKRFLGRQTVASIVAIALAAAPSLTAAQSFEARPVAPAAGTLVRLPGSLIPSSVSLSVPNAAQTPEIPTLAAEAQAVSAAQEAAAAAPQASAKSATALLAEPSAVAPSAQQLSVMSDEGARGAVDSAMARVLGEKTGEAQGVSAAPAGSARRWSSLAPAAYHALARRPGAGRALVARAAVALSLTTVLSQTMHFLTHGLALGPASTTFAIWSGTLLFWSILQSIVLHEVGHAWTAEKVGDMTARMAGQISLNPLRFTSPAGLTLLLVTSMLGVPFGFLATVMQESVAAPQNKNAMAKVALAGPAVNMILTVVMAGLALGVPAIAPGLAAMPWIGGTLRVLAFGALMNFLLGASNLVPIGPLDGQKVARAAAPKRWVPLFDKLTVPAGFIAILAWMAWMMAKSAGHAITHGGAGTPLAHTHNPFVMALLANGVLLWAIAMIPVVKAKFAEFKASLARQKVLAAGGVAVTLAINTVGGRAPAAKLTGIPAALPAAQAPVGLKSGVYDVVPVAEVDASLKADVAAGKIIAVKRASDDNAPVLAMPTEAIGGPAKAIGLLEAQAVAERLADHSRQHLLTPNEVEALKGLSSRLNAPVYQLDLAPASDAHPRLARYVPTDEGGAFFVDTKIVSKLAEDLPVTLGRHIDAFVYLMALRKAVQLGQSPVETERDYVQNHRAFRLWTRFDEIQTVPSRPLTLAVGDYRSANGSKVSVQPSSEKGAYEVRADAPGADYVLFNFNPATEKLFKIFSERQDFELVSKKTEADGSRRYSYRFGGLWDAWDESVELTIDAAGAVTQVAGTTRVARLSLPNGLHSGPLKQTMDVVATGPLTRVP